ncbi:unnamed protein product, partial [Thlaspi arvense]
MEGTVRCSANYVPLSPISFLQRSALVYGERISVVYGDVKFTWRETLNRCTRLASALTHLGVSRGDVMLCLYWFIIIRYGEKMNVCVTERSNKVVYTTVHQSSEVESWPRLFGPQQVSFPVTLLVPYSAASSFPSGIALGRPSKKAPLLTIFLKACPTLCYRKFSCRDGGLIYLRSRFLEQVASLVPNIPAMYELHFAVPMAGGVLCALNIRHDSNLVSVLLKHSEAKVFFVDYQFFNVAKEAIEILSKTSKRLPHLVLIMELDKSSPTTAGTVPSQGHMEYEMVLTMGRPDFEIKWPQDNGIPFHSITPQAQHQVRKAGAYLNSLATVILNEMQSMPVYLWTLPMFHCNGWCLTWGVAALGGTNVCLRNVTANGIFNNITQHNVTHISGAPTILNMIVNCPVSDRKPLTGKVSVLTGGAPPPPQVLFKMEELGFAITHTYGLTEVYGPATVCAWKPEWNSLPREAQAKIKARQGLHHLGLQEVDIKDPVTLKSVPPDAKTMGEVMFKGNTVMNDAKATQDAFRGGWYRTGDLAVKHPDGYIELKDRAKDIIISGGENISTIEVESVLFSHPAVLEAAVVGRPDEYWGETPCAFVKLKDGYRVSTDEITRYCRDHLPITWLLGPLQD